MIEITPGLAMSAYLLGKRIVGQRKRTPVAYLYNGVRLPGLPEWDKVKYPYAFIASQNSRWFLYCFSDEKKVSSAGSVTIIAPGAGFIYGDNRWEEYSSGGLLLRPIWSNYDIYYSDTSDDELSGTLYLANSEPVPIYARYE